MVLQELQEMIKSEISDPKSDWMTVTAEDFPYQTAAAAHSLGPVGQHLGLNLT
jgi:hypothetical protein